MRHSTSALAAALAAAACLIGASPAACEDAGGTRSVFSSGAGTRAFSLGGAFVAVADDASALLWNPGALGQVQRMELQLSHAGDGALGTREEFASFVLPSWRWGVFGVAVQHFAVGGIEARDDRNVLLEENLSDLETEITLGFGRALSPALSLGGAVKVQRQSLAGYTGSGLGADLGLLVRPGLMLGSAGEWAERIALGFSLRNAIAPSLRLDRESVPDPATARMGLAYRHPLAGGRSVVAALDLEQSAASGVRLHTGVECRLHPLLTVRAGMDHGALTAGTAVHWKEFAFEYAFENGGLDEVHRVGITRPIGPAVGERREAALLAEERAILARVESAASQRLALQVDGLMADARTAAAGGAYDRALEILGTIATIAPGRADAAALEGESLRGKAASLERAGDFMGAVLVYGRAIALAPGDSAAAAGELRCRAESDRRAARSARIRQDVAAAVAALAAGDLRAASEGFAHVLALDPGDREAAAMLERTVRAIAARGESYTRQARRSLEAGALDQAGEFLRAARALDPHASGLAEMEAALARARPGRVAEGADAASILPRAGAGGSSDARPKPVARHPGREVDDLYRRGLAAMAERRPDDALRYFELVQSLSPGYQRAVEYLKREYLTRGMEHFAAGRVEEAMSHWQKALAVDPADERTRGYLARAYTQIARTRELTGGSR